MHKTLVALLLVLASAFAWAEPSLAEVQSEVRLGHLTQAESMMKDVVAAHPESAKAHYVYAEVLGRNQKFNEAVTEAQTARTLDPAIKFTDAQKFKDFEQLLTRQQAATRMRGVPAPSTSSVAGTDSSSFKAPAATTPAMAPAMASSSGIPGWIWIVALAAIGWFLWRGFSKSRATNAGAASPGAVAYGNGGYPLNAPPAPNGPNGPYNPNAPYGQGMPQAAPGGGLLRTGLAVAGGVAGGMLIDQMLNHHANAAGVGHNPNDLGLGPTMAPQSNDASTELETRQVDFGNGNDWGGGGGGDIDTGSSDSGGSWD